MIRVSPALMKLTLSPGTTQVTRITVENLLQVPMPLRVSVEGFDANDEEDGIVTNTTAVPSPLINWISLDTKEAIIPAGKKRTFHCLDQRPAYRSDRRILRGHFLYSIVSR